MATKPSMKFIATTKEKLNTIPINAGQLIFVVDDRAIYLDVNGTDRTVYQSIITVIDEETRLNITSPIEGFYYVLQTNNLYSYYDGTWQLLIGGGDSNVIFVSSLPITGQSDILYILEDKIYGWNNSSNNYYAIGGGTGSIDWENYNP